MLDRLLSQALRENPGLVGLDDVVEKEILHHEILYFLHKEQYLSRLTFMGGTALRLCHGSNRLSEDLDFAGGQHFTPADFAGLSDALQQHLRKVLLLDVAVHEPQEEKGDTSSWKVTIEKFANRPDLPSQKLRIDVCAYPALDPVHLPVVDHYRIASKIDGLPIPVESLTEILADKMVAFAFRQRRIKPRDVWDIAWLSQRNIRISLPLIQEKLRLRAKEEAAFLELITKHSEAVRRSAETKQDFYQEMSRFVAPEVAMRTLQQDTFWPYVAGVIENYVLDVRAGFDGGNNSDNGMRM